MESYGRQPSSVEDGTLNEMNDAEVIFGQQCLITESAHSVGAFSLCSLCT